MKEPSPFHGRRAHNVVVRPALVLFATLVLACGAPAGDAPPPALARSVPADDLALGEEELAMELSELMCGPCAQTIVRGSEALPGVTSVRMTLATKTLYVRFDPAVVARAQVVASVERIVASIQ